jgi:hypothetical protein
MRSEPVNTLAKAIFYMVDSVDCMDVACDFCPLRVKAENPESWRVTDFDCLADVLEERLGIID